LRALTHRRKILQLKLIYSTVQRLAVFASLILALFAPGCASNSGGSVGPGGSGAGGSRTLRQVDLEVSAKMTRFENAVAAVMVTQPGRKQVNGAYTRYQAAYNKALQAAGNNPDAPAPENVKALATRVVDAVESVP
jgi:hypothetical protein